MKKVITNACTKEVEELQGFVWEALQKQVDTLTKPTMHGYAVDGMIKPANLLIEIKTGVSAHDIYTAVGQLKLYPSLINLPRGLTPVLLVPEEPALRPQMAAALADVNISVHSYSIGRTGQTPKIEFSPDFLDACRRRAGLYFEKNGQTNLE